MSKNIEKKIFVLSLGFLCLSAIFSYGVLVGMYKYWPYDTLIQFKSAAKMLFVHESVVSEDLFVTPASDAPRKDITIYEDTVQKGYYAFLGWDNREQKYSVWLYDDKGEKLHTWKIDYTSLDPDGPSNGTDMPHGLHVLSDGSLIVNFGRGGDVMARLDSCGQAIWVKDGIFHHSIEEDDDGAMWTWRGKGNSYGHYQYIVKFDAEDGSTIKEIDLIEDIIRPLGERSSIFGVRSDFQLMEFDKDHPKKYDVFHPNDVDILSADIEEAFPDFNAGDLLLSFRSIDLVTVIDPDSNRLKWWGRGPWVYQHDPDFTADGKISVYDNNTGGDRSEIIKIDPVTREISNDLLTGGFFFYNKWMGKHQYLPNGNVLLVSAGEGRVVVLSNDGRKLLEFNNIISEEYNGHVENGMWLPENYFDRIPSCS